MSRRAIRRLPVCLALLAAASVAAFALVAEKRPSRFDALAVDPAIARLGIVAETPEALPEYDTERQGWAAFKLAHGGGWTIHVDRRSGAPLLVQGQGIRWYPDGSPVPSAAVLEEKARAFVGTYEHVFKVKNTQLVYDPVASGAQDADHAIVVFRRVVDGIPVDGQRFLLFLSHGNLVSFGADRWGPLDRAPEASYTLDTARQVLWSYMGITPKDAVEELDAVQVIVAAAPEAEGAYAGRVGRGIGYARAFRFALRVAGERGTWVGEVDASTGKILSLYDDNKYAQVKGGTFPVSNDGLCPDGCEQPNFPMPYADVTINGSPFTAGDMGLFDCSPAGGTAVTHLAGPYIRVQDNCGPVNQSIACDADLDLQQGPGTDCAIPAGSSAGNTHSSRSSFYHLNRVMEKGRAWLPTNTWLQSQLVDNVNINSTCNAFWSGSVNFYRSGGGCRNTGEIAGVFVHEWGHGIDQNDGGGYDNPSEAYADTVAYFQTHVSCIGRGFFESGNCSGYGNACLNCSGIRDQDWDMRANHVPSTADGFIQNNCGGGSGPCGKETHCEGYLVSETVWDLAVRDLPASGLNSETAWQVADRIFYKSRQGSGGNAYNCSIPNSDGCNAGGWFNTFRTVDDDDGNLNNGTPHGAAIFNAFKRHKIACGNASDPSNQSFAACTPPAAPVLSATAGSNAASLSWNAVPGATKYVVLRNDSGCNAGHTVIAEVNAPGTTYTDTDLPNGFASYYAVQAQGSASSCLSTLSNCMAVTPQPFAGTIKFGQPSYNCGSSIQIQVLDANVGAATTTVEVWSTSEPAHETVILTETPPGSSKYYGSIQATSGTSVTGDGLLRVSNLDSLGASYLDANDGQGGTNLLRTTSAAADCIGPLISSIGTSGISDVAATVNWTTDESSSSILHWGEQKPPTTDTSNAALVTSHTVPLTGLRSCTVYWYSVESLDFSQNSALDNRGGQYYSFETLGDLGNGLQPCHRGTVSLNKSILGCSDALTVKLVDLDLNLSSVAVDTIQVEVSSSTETVPEVLTLTETGPNTSQFTGVITTSPGAVVNGNGVLETRTGDLVTATYHDGNDGTGQAAVSFKTATADCAAPSLSNVRVTDITDDSAIVRWETSEGADSKVEWGPTAALGSVVTDASLVSSHAVTIGPLTECGHFYFRVTSKDVYGNTRVYDATGTPFEFNAYIIPGVFRDNFETSTGWTLEGDWQINAPLGKGTAPGDPTQAFTPTKVLGQDLTGLGANPGDYEGGTNFRAISPVINTSALTGTQLKFRRWLNVAGGAIAYVEVKKNNIWNTVWTSPAFVGVSDSAWVLQTVDIGAYADGNTTTQIAFRTFGGPGSGNNRAGWNVDRFVVKSGQTPAFDVCGGCGGPPTFAGAVAAADVAGCADTGVQISWAAAPAWGTGHGGSYSVYRSTDPAFTPSAGNRIATGVSGTSYTDTTAPNAQNLYYIVRAENDETCSTGPKNGGVTDSNLVRVLGRDETSQPDPGSVGSSLALTSVNDAHVRLTWNPSPTAARYRVYRAQSPQGPFAAVAEIAGTLWDDADQMGDSANRFYTVRTLDACGNEGP